MEDSHDSMLIFVGEAALIYFWQRYRIPLAERQKHFVEEQQVKAMKKRLEEAENLLEASEGAARDEEPYGEYQKDWQEPGSMGR